MRDILEDARLDECNGIDRRTILEAVQASDVHLGKGLCPDVLEAALRKTTVERHLTALKAAADTAAGTGLLPLHAARRSLAHTRADAAADTLARGTRSLSGL